MRGPWYLAVFVATFVIVYIVISLVLDDSVNWIGAIGGGIGALLGGLAVHYLSRRRRSVGEDEQIENS